MLLRSVNAPVSPPVIVGGGKMATVIYDGLVDEFATVTARIELIGTAFLFGNLIAFGIRVPRLSLMAVLTRRELPFCNVGVRVSCSVSEIFSLIPGDSIECHVQQQIAGRWLLVAQGFTVIVR